MAEATVGLLRVVLSSNSAQFDSSMDKSGAKVTAFGESGKRAAASLARLVNDFNGSKVTAEATKMAAAIEKVGGVSKLTDADLGRVNRTLDHAIAKYKILGQEVPPHIAKLKAEVSALDKASGTAATGGLGQFSGALSMVGRILPALGIASAVTSILRLGSSALEAADKHVTFADKLGVSTETTQRWAFVAGQTGTTMEAFGNAAFKLGVNVGNGTDKVRKAVSDLNLSYVELKNTKPEEQMAVVMKALEGVESATERNRIGQILYGKTFAEISAAIGSEYTKLMTQADVVADRQVRAAERAGDAWTKLKGKIAAVSLELAGGMAQNLFDTAAAMKLLVTGTEKYTAVQRQMIAAIQAQGGEGLAALIDSFEIQGKFIPKVTAATVDYVAKLAALRAEVALLTPAQKAQIDAAIKTDGITEELSDTLGVSVDVMRLYQSGLKGSAKDLKEFESEAKKAAKAAQDFADSVRNVQASNRTAFGNVFTVPKSVDDSSELIGEIRESMDAMASISFDSTWVPFVKGVTASEAGVKRLAAGAQTLAEKYADVGRNISSIIVGSAMGGGNALQSLGGLAGQKLGEMAGKKIATALGGKLGSMLGGAAGPVGAALGSLAGSLAGSALGKLFGGGEHKKVNDLRDGFVSAAGGIHQLNVKAQAAGLTLDRLLRAKTVKDYEAAILELNTAFQEQGRILSENTQAASTLFDDIMSAGADGIPAAYRPAIEQLIALGLLTDEQAAKLRGLTDSTGVNVNKMTEAMDLFKGRIEALGPAYRQAKLDETSKKYINAMDALIKGGADVGGVLFDAREEFGALVAQAIKGGQTLPANMKPWIDDLFNAGNLLDENGEKITDISGLKYGEAQKTEAEIAEEGWTKILAAIQELIDKINGPLHRAIENIPDAIIKIGADTGDLDRALNREGTNQGFSAGMMGAVPFAPDIFSGIAPNMAAFAGMGSGGGRSTSSTANNFIMVPMPSDAVGDSWRMTRAVIRAIPPAILMNEADIRKAIESVYDDRAMDTRR